MVRGVHTVWLMAVSFLFWVWLAGSVYIAAWLYYKYKRMLLHNILEQINIMVLVQLIV